MMEAFVDVHQEQLRAIGFPPELNGRLYEKLVKEDFQSGGTSRKRKSFIHGPGKILLYRLVSTAPDRRVFSVRKERLTQSTCICAPGQFQVVEEEETGSRFVKSVADLEAHGDVFLVDHAWTFDVETYR